MIAAAPTVKVMVRLPESIGKEVRHLAADLRGAQGVAMTMLLRAALDLRAAAERAAGGGE